MSRGPFAEAAFEAALGCRFRPGQHEGHPVATLAYLIRSPVTTTRSSRKLKRWSLP
jgi:hypothetical protein